MCPAAPPERKESYTVRVLIRVFPDGARGNLEKLLGYVLIRNPRFADPKSALPGGGARKGESLLGTAVREVREETALIIEPASLEFFGEVLKNPEDNHYDCGYLADIEWSECTWMNAFESGNEGEVPFFITCKQMRAGELNPPLLESHDALLKAFGIDLMTLGE